MARGPYGWRNHRAARAGVGARERVEAVLASDAPISGSIHDGLGPYQVLNALSSPTPGLSIAMVVRATFHLTAESHQDATVLTTDTSTFHDGTDIDEVAALLSLAGGLRCRSGGVTRMWGLGEDLSGFGVPAMFDYRMPVLPIPSPRSGPLLPHLTRPIDINSTVPLLRRYFASSPKDATALLRAARMYQRAVWVADDDPSQAWLWLVGALEVAAVRWRGSARDPGEVLRRAWSELSEVALKQGEDHHEEIAMVVNDLIKSKDRFAQFVLEFIPDPPASRPEYWAQADWNDMERMLHQVYGFRSKALHAGVPFPVPMCEAPHPHTASLPEIPMGRATYANDGRWAAEDVPMLLWTFEYVARGALVNWWSQLASEP